MWAATRVTPSAPSENPVAMDEGLEEGEVDERNAPDIQQMPQSGSVAKVPVENVTAVRTLEKEFKNAAKQEEKAVVANLAMSQGVSTPVPNAGADSTEAPNAVAQSFTAQSVMSRTKRKKNKGSRSPTPEKDLSQWYCAICRVQCNADPPFQDHLKSAKHIRVLQGPAAGSSSGSIAGARCPHRFPLESARTLLRERRRKQTA